MRISMSMFALLPAKCDECHEMYCVDHNSDPLFICFRCFQGAHSCDAYKLFNQTISQSKVSSGFVWVCTNCYEQQKPLASRKDRSRHVNGANSSPCRSRNTSDSQHVNQPSKLPLNVVKAISPTRVNVKINASEDSHTESKGNICPNFVQWKCLHGIRGNKLVDGSKCSLPHPKVCNRFRRHGSLGQHGCQGGDSCTGFHPTVCENVVKSGTCSAKSCKLLHPLTFKKKIKIKPTRKDDQSNSSNRSIKNNGSKPAKMQANFLELKNLMVGMSTKFDALQKEVELLKISNSVPQPTAPQQCPAPRQHQILQQYPAPQQYHPTFRMSYPPLPIHTGFSPQSWC